MNGWVQVRVEVVFEHRTLGDVSELVLQSVADEEEQECVRNDFGYLPVVHSLLYGPSDTGPCPGVVRRGRVGLSPPTG